jgi:hypothetical protein
VIGRLAVVAAVVLLAGCGNDPVAHRSEAWSADIVSIDCCTTTRLPSPDSTRTLIFEPDADEKIHVRLSAGWLRQQEIAVTGMPSMASWAPDGRGFFISNGEGSGQTSVFRLFRTPDNGADIEIPAAHREAVAAYRAHVGCPADAFDPEVWGLGWSRDGRRALLLVQSSIHQPCGRADRYMVMAVAADDGRLLEQYDTAEAAERFAALIPANVRGVTGS